MSHLPPLPRFAFVPGISVEPPFDVLVDEFRQAPIDAQVRLDECVAMDDGAAAVVALTKLYLGLQGTTPGQEAIRRVLPLRDVAKSRNVES
ncbi:hypothetical protein [Achromobacter sp. DH1f]|uniref:hypothetical protein n=1 Tax=Achromobacter sp. DH1f TaxID=1397275 RepID=UPI0009DE6EE6|nr:hypothetical protein [Achromobacter sp. DH1f]